MYTHNDFDWMSELDAILHASNLIYKKQCTVDDACKEAIKMFSHNPTQIPRNQYNKFRADVLEQMTRIKALKAM